MAKGRFLSKSISNSKRFADLSPGAALLYLLSLPHADVAGLLESDPETLVLVYGGRFAARHSWTADSATAMRDELVASGLWTQRGDGVVEVDKFHDHNKVRESREGPSRLRASSGSPPGVLRESSRILRECATTSEGEEKRSEVKEKGTSPAFHVDDELPRIRRAFARAFEQVTKTPFTMKPADQETFRLAAQLGTCRPWPADQDLLGEFARTLQGMQRRGVRYSVRTAINHLGESWDEPHAQRQNGKDPFPEVVYEDFTGRGKRGTADATD